MPKAKTKRLTDNLSLTDAKKFALSGLSNLVPRAIDVLSEALDDGDRKVAQWLAEQFLDLESVETLERKQPDGGVVLPMDPTERAKALEGLRLIKQAERRQ